MKNLSLRSKLMLGFSIPIVMMIIIVTLSIISSNNLRLTYSEVANFHLPVITALEEIKFSGSRLISSTNELLVDFTLDIEETSSDDEEQSSEASQIADAIDMYHSALEQYSQIIAQEGPEDAELLKSIETAGQAVIDTSNEILDVIENNNFDDLAEIREEFEAEELAFFLALDKVIEIETDELIVGQADVDALVNQSSQVAIGLIMLTLILTLAASLFVLRTLLPPMHKLRLTAEALRKGDMKQRAQIDSTDEIGQLAGTFNLMAQQIEKLVGDLQQEVDVAEAARAQAERSDQVKSAFLASMSHELRTPLNAVINFTKFVAKGDLGPVNEEQAETLYEVVDSAKHLLNLINDVLDMSKIESGSLNLFIVDDIDVRTIINQAVSTGKILLEDKPVELQTEIEDMLPTIRGDRQRLLQIMLNIISNACKFTDEGSILIQAKHVAKNVIISVKDTGAGIAPADQAAVFEAFKQTTTGLRQGGGTGLGMPITKNLVEAHGGSIRLDSDVNMGTTFTISIPVESEDLVPLLS